MLAKWSKLTCYVLCTFEFTHCYLGIGLCQLIQKVDPLMTLGKGIIQYN